VLVEVAGDALREKLPRRYRDRVVATRLAARFVYREGVDALAHVPEGGLGPAVLRYHAHEVEVARLAAAVRASGVEGAERAAALLEAGGPRVALFEAGAPRAADV
jgi:hypothetical protein